jgi:protein TonB
LAAHHYRLDHAQEATPLRRRVSGMALAIAIEVLLLLALLTIDFRDKPPPQFKGGAISTFDLAADQQDASPSEAAPARAIKEVPHPKLPPVKPTITERPLPIMEVSKEFLDASDISKLGSNAPGAGQLARRSTPGDSEMVGNAPNGEPLYAAEWYRRPTDTELGA